MSKFSVNLDAVLYVLVAMFAAMNSSLGGDESAKMIPPEILYWAKFIVTAAGSGALALKMFRSTSFADSKKTTTDTK